MIYAFYYVCISLIVMKKYINIRALLKRIYLGMNEVDSWEMEIDLTSQCKCSEVGHGDLT